MALPLEPEEGRSGVKLGDRFGRLTVMALVAGRRLPPRRASRAIVRCDCGTEASVDRSSLARGQSRSCGCLAREVTSERSLRHGHAAGGSTSREYRSWMAAKTRVSNPRDPHWPDYGGRGIQMFEGWRNDFAAFLAHVGPRPVGTSLDRIDPNGDYAPGNVRWATPLQQRHNRRNSRAA